MEGLRYPLVGHPLAGGGIWTPRARREGPGVGYYKQMDGSGGQLLPWWHLLKERHTVQGGEGLLLWGKNHHP